MNVSPVNVVPHSRPAPWQVPVLWFCRSAVAATWLYNGFWLKLLDERGHHAMIVAEASGLSPGLAYALTAVIGVLECSLAFVVMSQAWDSLTLPIPWSAAHGTPSQLLFSRPWPFLSHTLPLSPIPE